MPVIYRSPGYRKVLCYEFQFLGFLCHTVFVSYCWRKKHPQSQNLALKYSSLSACAQNRQLKKKSFKFHTACEKWGKLDKWIRKGRMERMKEVNVVISRETLLGKWGFLSRNFPDIIYAFISICFVFKTLNNFMNFLPPLLRKEILLWILIIFFDLFKKINYFTQVFVNI